MRKKQSQTNYVCQYMVFMSINGMYGICWLEFETCCILIHILFRIEVLMFKNKAKLKKLKEPAKGFKELRVYIILSVH